MAALPRASTAVEVVSMVVILVTTTYVTKTALPVALGLPPPPPLLTPPLPPPPLRVSCCPPLGVVPAMDGLPRHQSTLVLHGAGPQAPTNG